MAFLVRCHEIRLPENFKGKIWADCASVISSANNRKWAIGERRPCAGFWRSHSVMTRLKTGMVCKTKAHRTYEEAVANQDQDNWVGNDWADHYAKKAAQEHRARDVVIGNWKGIIDRTKRAAWAMIVILERWPKNA